MLLIHLLNNFQQECLLRQMERLLEKHPYAIDAFIVDFSSMMFAKENELTVASNTLMLLIHLLNNFQQMFAKANGSTVGKTP